MRDEQRGIASGFLNKRTFEVASYKDILNLYFRLSGYIKVGVLIIEY